MDRSSRKPLPGEWETGLHGRSWQFHTTAWSRLLSPDERPAALRFLAERYWKPVYAYIRVGRKVDEHRARDLTQEFFLWVIESGWLDKVRPALGNFRGFLKRTLANFLIDQARRRSRLKRGGERLQISLDALEESRAEPGAPGESPDHALDREWRDAILARAREEVRAELRSEGRETWLRFWEEYDLAPAGARPDQSDLARRHGVSRREVSSAVVRVRERFRARVIEAVRETVPDEGALRDELRELFASRP
jgi:RNA polymerase sigma-70 factor (ECF subfamily)